MISFKNIKKQFHGKEILKGIDGEFKSGTINLVVGSSGTGKSVLIKSIIGLITLDAGTIYFDNYKFDEKDLKFKNFLRKQTGMLFQGGALFDSLSVIQNVTFPLDTLTNLSFKVKYEKGIQSLKRVGLVNIEKKRISELSGGMQKRVGIARAIINNPKYLFFDEPNSGLDPQTSLLIDELIKEITHEYKTTSVVVTHDINSMLTIGENIMFLYEGKKTWEGNYKNLFKSQSPTFNNFFFSNEMAKIIKTNNYYV